MYILPILRNNLMGHYTTMKEGMYMTFFGALSIIGFILFGIIKYMSKRNNDNAK